MVVAALLILLFQSDIAWTRIRVPDPVAGAALRKTLDGVADWLDKPECRALLTEFSDGAGRPLATGLAGLGVDVQTYLGWVVFEDGSRHRRCAGGDVAFTQPGGRVVYVCGERLKETWQRDRALATASLTHEVLHTLGLGENPPSSREITKRVLARCAH